MWRCHCDQEGFLVLVVHKQAEIKKKINERELIESEAAALKALCTVYGAVFSVGRGIMLCLWSP